jgi:hypothetical protein
MLQLANRPIGRWFFDHVGMGVPPAKLHEKPDARGGAGGFACQPAGRPATFFPASWFFVAVLVAPAVMPLVISSRQSSQTSR